MKSEPWMLIGFLFHKWRTGKTWNDTAGGDHLTVHHGWYSLEWARGKNIDFYRSLLR